MLFEQKLNNKVFDEGAAGGGENSGENNSSNGAGANEGKTYTQADLDRMFADRARQAESSLLKRLGFEKAEDAQAAIKKLKTIEDGQKSDLQKAQEEIAELRRANTEQKELSKRLLAQYEVGVAASKLGIVDPDAAFRLLDQSKLEFDDSGKLKNAEMLLKALITEKPYLAGGGTSATNASRNTSGSGTFTRSQIEDRKFWEAHREEILKAMADGRIVED